MNTVKIEGVNCRMLPADSSHKTEYLLLEIPMSMTGDQLKNWKDRNKAEAIRLLSEVKPLVEVEQE